MFGLCVAVYTLSHYGGVRSPDGEVYYLTAEALATRASFAVEGDLDLWPGFGLAPGTDGRRYSIFAPTFPVVAAPLVWGGKRVGVPERAERAQRDFPPSLYTANGLATVLSDTPPGRQGPWAIRFVASFVNLFLTSLCVVVFFGLLRALGLRTTSAYGTATLFAFGSLTWPYAGMFLSEPLATLSALASCFFLLRRSQGASVPPPAGDALLAGILLGLSVTTHVASLLFAPFFLAQSAAPGRGGWRAAGGFALGFAALLALLGVHHYLRFGDPFETGRTLDEVVRLKYGYGEFVAPWPGLLGLLISPAKGLFLYCPAVLLGLAAWPHFHRRHPRLSWLLAGMIAFRTGALAFRSDWPGGFCLGPRYLVPVLPYLLIPAGLWLDARLRARDFRAVALACGVGLLCIAQQLYFALGEVCSFFHYKNFQLLRGPGASHPWGSYFEWDFAPLTQIWQVRRGPFLLRELGASNEQLFALGALLLLVLLAGGAYASLAAERCQRPDSG